MNLDGIDDGWLGGRVVDTKRLSAAEHFQDTRHIDVQVDFANKAGDVLCVMPNNDKLQVDRLLTLLGWQSVADVPCHVDFLPDTTTLRKLLTHHLDCFSMPKTHGTLLNYLSHFTTN